MGRELRSGINCVAVQLPVLMQKINPTAVFWFQVLLRNAVAFMQVVSYAAMSIALLCNSPYYCETNPIGGLQHQFYELGAVEKMMAFLSKQPSKRKQRCD